MSLNAVGQEHPVKTPPPYDDTKPTDTLVSVDQRPPTTSAAITASALRYRHRALWLLVFYIPLLLVPWILTCVLVYHPIDHSSYFDQSGIASRNLTLHRRLINALTVINSITGIVTVPIISALIAQAAVLYAQKRRKTQFLSVRQVFALTDRGWSNLSILTKLGHLGVLVMADMERQLVHSCGWRQRFLCYVSFLCNFSPLSVVSIH
jgi:hypothetical protein